MKVLIGSTELTVNNCYAYRYQNGKLVLKIEVPQSEIAHDDLKALLKDNTDDIIKVDGDNRETFSGFRYTLTILDRDDVYECEVECVSEMERKVGDLEKLLEEEKAVINEQREEIALLNDTLLEIIM